jgi:glycerophosphoryl diester phosphodiesterase
MVHPFLQHDGPIPFAHRGGPVANPENTLAAFESAYALGYRYFETDVHASADGALVSFHDQSLKRLTGERTRLRTLTEEQLREVRVDGEPVPLLAELLDGFPDVRINIDPKSDEAVRPLVQTLTDLDALDRVCCASFSGARLRFLRAALGPRLCTAASPQEIAAARWEIARGHLPRLPHVDLLQVPIGPRGLRVLTPRLIARCHDAGLPVQVWTVNDRSTMEWLLDSGVDGIMSDDLQLLREVFVERGLWRE